MATTDYYLNTTQQHGRLRCLAADCKEAVNRAISAARTIRGVLRLVGAAKLRAELMGLKTFEEIEGFIKRI